MRIRARLTAFAISSMLAATSVIFTTGAARTAPADPCSVVSTQRVGAWVCIDPKASRASMEKHIAAQRGKPLPAVPSDTTTITKVPRGCVQQAVPTVAEATSGDGKAGWCSGQGCWYLYAGENTTTTYHAAEYDGTGFYGYGGVTIGSMDFHI